MMRPIQTAFGHTNRPSWESAKMHDDELHKNESENSRIALLLMIERNVRDQIQLRNRHPHRREVPRPVRVWGPALRGDDCEKQGKDLDDGRLWKCAILSHTSDECEDVLY